MSLIDKSFFTGPLTIAQLGQQSVVDDLNIFINQNENLFLQAALGYGLWEDFITGLAQPVIDSRWTDLLNGATFITTNNWPSWYWGYTWFNSSWYLNSQRPQRWVGFANGSSTFAATAGSNGVLPLVVGSGANNPISGSFVFTLSTLNNATYSIERRGFGTLVLGTDYSLSNNNQTITLLNSPFNAGETYFIHLSSVSNAGTASQSYKSPIAGYIYWLYQMDLFQQQTGVGVVKSAAQNAGLGNPTRKMVDGFNAMANDIFILWQFLETQWYADPTIYASYDRTKIDYMFFKPQNFLSI